MARKSNIDNMESEITIMPQCERAVVPTRTVLRVIRLLELLTRYSEGCSLTEISSELGFPKSSLLVLLRPLVAEGYILRSEMRYRLGPRMFNISAQVLEVRHFPNLLRPFLVELGEKSQESVYLAVLDRQAKVLTFLDMVPSKKHVRLVLPVGSVRPLYPTAAGRALLAYQDKEWQEDYIENVPRQPLTPLTHTDADWLRSELALIRSEGLSVTIGQSTEGGGAIAAPIFGPQGQIEAAFVIAAPTQRLQEHLPRFRELIRDVAARASGRVSTVSAD